MNVNLVIEAMETGRNIKDDLLPPKNRDNVANVATAKKQPKPKVRDTPSLKAKDFNVEVPKGKAQHIGKKAKKPAGQKAKRKVEPIPEKAETKNKVNENPKTLTATAKSSLKDQPIPEDVEVKSDDEDNVNITIAKFTVGPVNKLAAEDCKTHCQSPLTGGNLGPARPKEVADRPENGTISPPSSTSTMSTKALSARLEEVADQVNKIADPNVLGIDHILTNAATKMDITEISAKPPAPDINLDGADNLAKSDKDKLVTPEKIKVIDVTFMPVDITVGRTYTFVTSQATNQVYVFQDGDSKGVLKINESKLFSSPHNVHFVPNLTSESSDLVVVLDNSGFHFYKENGAFVRTMLYGVGHKYRGLGHLVWPEGSDAKRCIVTLDISRGDGTYLTIFNIDGPEFKVANIFLESTKGKADAKTKCRFLTVRNSVIIISAMESSDVIMVNVNAKQTGRLNFVEKVDRVEETTFGGAVSVPQRSPVHIRNPTGVAFDKKGRIYIASVAQNSIQVFSGNGEKIGNIGDGEKFKKPLGLCINDDWLFVASEKRITKLPIF